MIREGPQNRSESMAIDLLDCCVLPQFTKLQGEKSIGRFFQSTVDLHSQFKKEKRKKEKKGIKIERKRKRKRLLLLFEHRPFPLMSLWKITLIL